MSDVQRHKMLRSRQPSFLIGEDSLMKEVMSHAIQNFRDALQPAKHWSLPQKTLRMQRKHGWKRHWRMVQRFPTRPQ